MNKTLKKFAIAILATGATAAATTAMAVDTNTFTNAIQSVTMNLTIYSNSPVKTSVLQSGGKPVTLTTKSFIAALSNASATIPSLVGFNFGRSPQLVIDTTFQATNIQLYTTNAVLTNTVLLSTTNASTIYFGSNTYGVGSNLTVGTNTIGTFGTNLSGGYAIITNNATSSTNAGTNVITVFGNWAASASLLTNYISYLGTNGADDTVTTNSTGAFLTNVGYWTLITAATNASGTNLTIYTLSNTPSGILTNFATNGYSSIKVEGGTAADPVFADVSSFFQQYVSPSVVITATGTNLLVPTNDFIATETYDGIKHVNIGVFGVTGTAVGDNLSLNLSGFAKGMFKYDVLHLFPKKETNEVPESTSTGTVSGSGNIGGTFLATNAPGAGTNYVSVYSSSEYYGTNTASTNNIGGGTALGIIINPIPVVVEGTITVGPPHSVAQ